MKIRAERKALAEAVAWAAQALPKSHATPALSGIRLAANEDGLTLQAFDYDIGHTAKVECEVITPGEVLASGRFLSMVVAGLRGADVDLVLDGADLAVTSARSSYRVRSIALKDYPALPEFAGRAGVIDSAVLSDLVRVAGAPVDENSPHEQALGVHFESDGDDTLWAVGSAGIAAIHVVTAKWSPDGPIDATAPRSALAAAIKGMSGSIEIGREDGVLSLRDSARVVTMRTYAATYQAGAWRKVLSAAEAATPVVVEVDASELLDAVKSAHTLGADKASDLKGAVLNLVFEHDSITVSHHSEHGEGNDVIDASGPESPTWVAAASHLLTYALTPLAGGPVQIRLASAGDGGVKPMLFRHPDHDAARFVVMPRKWTGGDPR